MKKIRQIARLAGLLSAFLLTAALSLPAFGAEENRAANSDEQMAHIEEKWGIRPMAIRLTGADHFLDFRFLVTDPEKAKPVLARGKKAYLMDQDSGRIYNVTVNKIGPMRGTTVKPKKGKQYIILFTNSASTIRRGSKVSIVIGDFKVENLTIE